MIKNIKIIKYRKLENLTIDFCSNINVIAGTNGTCKTSILYMISNAYKNVTSNQLNANTKEIHNAMKKFTDKLNPKLESLTKGDEKYNNPAPDIRGTLYEITSIEDRTNEFRRHNSGNTGTNRFRLIPKYSKNSSEKLKAMPVMYLGLSRLVSYGEIPDDIESELLEKKIEGYEEKLSELYEGFTSVKITNVKKMAVKGVKTRHKFNSNEDGVDSNTISSGEDNLLSILKSLVLLRLYYESQPKDVSQDYGSLLLIDEIDATLHPRFQKQLIDVIEKYSLQYNIQCFFTSHSSDLIEYCLEKKHDITFLLDEVDKVSVLKNEDLGRSEIAMYLHSVSRTELNFKNSIVIYSEDKEARWFIKSAIRNLKQYDDSVCNCIFKYVDISIGSEPLKQLFKDKYSKKVLEGAICIMDGDAYYKGALNNYTIFLPGKKQGKSPEKYMFDFIHAEYKSSGESLFNTKQARKDGYIKSEYKLNVLPRLKKIEANIKEAKNNGSAKGKSRELYKKEFKNYEEFYKYAIDYMFKKGSDEISEFYTDLKRVCLKAAKYTDILDKQIREIFDDC